MRTRLKRREHYRVGDGSPENAFVHIDIRGRKGRTLEQKKAAVQTVYDQANKTELWGGYNYTPDKDVVRVPMKRAKNTMSVEQLTWTFANMTATGGEIVIMWDREIASVAFKI